LLYRFIFKLSDVGTRATPTAAARIWNASPDSVRIIRRPIPESTENVSVPAICLLFSTSVELAVVLIT